MAGATDVPAAVPVEAVPVVIVYLLDSVVQRLDTADSFDRGGGRPMTVTGPRLPSADVPVPDDLATQLRDVRERLASLDAQREELVRNRDALIRRARQSGASLREIAELCGLSHQAVALIEERSS